MRTLRVPHTSRAALGTAVGAALGVAGLAEARRLARGDDATTVRSARMTGPVRAGAGALLLARPQLLLAAAGAGSDHAAPRWLIRMLAVREIVLGTALSAAAGRHDDPRPWLLAAAAIDGAECFVVLDAVARGQLAAMPALGFAAADVGGGLVAAGVVAQRHRHGQRLGWAGNAQPQLSVPRARIAS